MRSNPTTRATDGWVLDYGGRHIELDADEEAWRLRVNQEQVAILVGRSSAARFGNGDVLVEVDIKYGGEIKRVALVVGENRIPFDPPHGTELATDGEERQARASIKPAIEGGLDASTRRLDGRAVDPWSGRSGGHRIEVDSDGESDARLWVDGKVVAVVQGAFGRVPLAGL